MYMYVYYTRVCVCVCVCVCVYVHAQPFGWEGPESMNRGVSASWFLKTILH